MAKTLINHVRIVTMDENKRVISDGWILIDGNQIEALGSAPQAGACSGTNPFLSAGQPADTELLPQAERLIDGRGGILLPGLINTHCHVSMMPFRSLGDDCADRLRRFLFPLENDAMTRRLVYLAARYGICEMLLAGVTTFVDMYYFEEEVARACEELGIRGVLGETVIGQPTCDSPEAYGGLKLAEAFIREWKGKSGRVLPIIAPHATNTNSPEALKAAYEIAVKYDTLYTLHASEMDYEMSYFKDTYQKTPIEFLSDLGVLGRRTLAAHCIHLTDRDVELLKTSGTSVSHCIGSNTKAGKGVAPVNRLAAKQIPVGLGTDGASSGNTLDLFTQFRLFASFQKTENRDRSLFPAEEIVKLGTAGGARALHLEREIGALKPGMKADLTLVETESVNMFPCYAPYSGLVYSANASNVSLVMADGQVLVQDKQLTRVDLRQIRSELEAEMGPFMEAAERYRDIL